MMVHTLVVPRSYLPLGKHPKGMIGGKDNFVNAVHYAPPVWTVAG